MGAYTGSIPNLIGGVSQQPPEIRPINTSTHLKNSFSSVLAGLGKRPASRYVGYLASFTGNDDVAQIEFRGPDGNYRLISVTDRLIKILNLSTGLQEPVSFTGSAQTYLPTGSSNRNVGLMAVQDTVFIYNKSKTITAANVSETGSGRFNPDQWATVWVKQTTAHSNYSVYVNGDLKANVQTGDGGYSYDAGAVANQLHTLLESAGYTVFQNGTVLDFQIPTGASIETRDGLGGSGLKAYTSFADQFTDLPPSTFDGRLLKVRGDLEDGGDDYFVVWEDGAWTETHGWNAGRSLTASTMPHVLVYDGDGTWTFKEHTWSQRYAGDAESNADPSFVGNKIQRLFRIKGRLGVLSDENVILSVTNAFEDFYRYSCTQLFDDDRVDTAADGSTQRGTLNFIVENQDDIIVFSDDAQFKLSYVDNILGPNTIDLKQTTTYKCSPLCEPAYMGPNLVFVDGFGESVFDSMREYTVDQNSLIAQAQEITSSVPEYIPAGTYKLASSSSENSMVALTNGDRSKLWFYQWFYNSEGKAQSAWQQWEFKNTKIYNAAYVEDKLYITFTNDSNLVGGQNKLMVSVIDPTLYLNSSFTLDRVLLDHKIDQSQVGVSFDGERSTVTLPYSLEKAAATVITENGRVYDAVGPALTTAVFEGTDLTSQNFVVGVKYTWEWELSPLFYRDQNQVAIQDGRFQLNYISFLTNATSYFQYDITPISRPTYSYTYVARGFNAANNNFGPTAIANKEVKIAAFGEGSKTKIKLYSDSPYPVRISNFEWRGLYRPRTKRK